MISVEEYKKLQEENAKLKKQVKKYSRRVKQSISKNEMEYVLDRLVPNVDDDSDFLYDTYWEMNVPWLTYPELLKMLSLLMKANRYDLVHYLMDKYITQDDLIEVEINDKFKDELKVSLNMFVKTIVDQRQIQDYHLEILFQILTFKSNYLFASVFNEMFNVYVEQITTACFKFKNGWYLTQLLLRIWLFNRDVLPQFINFMYRHYDLWHSWISDAQLIVWENIVNSSGHEQFISKINALKEYKHLQKNGLAINHVEPVATDHEHKSDLDTKQWNDRSELRKYGYEVTNKTTLERQAALHRAMKHIPLHKIVSHIQWLLQNSYKKHGVRGDYSRSINAYEMDLEHLDKIFKQETD
ncbi:hypothetical protein EJF36_12515 [Bacillus sp. HMF5848]|uniref:hypothetical protein n=1 Tax=Bacillus sp. HMF5848 TaxID=2495421 RepID=UPI000F79473D|nr:hypothetical protein [Bacillus sp. HMF5848]RSK27633.1 hypothetical protein EJF36_12515 [Bacillus sp. HMF5848]